MVKHVINKCCCVLQEYSKTWQQHYPQCDSTTDSSVSDSGDIQLESLGSSRDEQQVLEVE